MSWTRKAYPSEYVSYQEMKRRMRLNGLPLAEEFATFSGFMEIVGPKPHPTYSLNRQVNENPAYEPGGVSWASKRDQSNNRRNTVRLTYSGTELPHFMGQTKALAEWARLRNFKQPVMHQRRKRGWSDNENIEGQRSPVSKSFDQMSLKELVAFQPWTKQNAERNERDYVLEKRDGESRLEYRSRRLADEATDKWQALLRVATLKDSSLSFNDILSTTYPDKCFSPKREVRQEQFQFHVEEWKERATRWSNARDDFAKWEAATTSKESNNSLHKLSRDADSDVAKRLGSVEPSSDYKRRHPIDEDDLNEE